MSRPGWPVTLVRNLALAAVLGALHRRAPLPAAASHRSRWLAPGLALLGPAGCVVHACRRRGGRWAPPRSPAARVLLAGHALAGAAAEELAWRGPLLHLRPGPGRLVAAVAGGVGFVAAHLPRDGRRGIPVHAVTTASWTAAALTGRRLRWSILAHAAYNVAAVVLRPPAGDPGSPA